MFYFIFFNLFILDLFHYNFSKISIIIPIYNVNIYLKECLDSIKNQTLKNIEIICVNDGSTDNSLEIILEYMNDNRFIVIDKHNSGYGDSMNNGFYFATGEYIAIVESDDFVDFNMFNYLYKKTIFDDIDIVRSNYILYWDKNNKKDITFNSNILYDQIFQPIDFPNIFFISPSIWTGIYKRNFLINNNIKFLPTPGASYQDTSFFFKTLFKSKNVLFVNKSFYYYRQTNLNSSVKNKSLSKAIFINKEFYEIDKYFQKDLKLFYQIEKYYNTKKIKTLFWNLKRIENKKDYFKIFYKDVYNILKNKNYFQYKFNNYELRLFNYSLKYGEEIASDIFLNSKILNLIHPKISIIIPFYNSENFILESLNSLINQTFKNFEIICISDGTADNSLKILREFQKKDNRIRIITQNNKENLRNIGIKESKGDYLLFLDFDDIFNETMVEELYAQIKGNDLEVIICNSQVFKIHNNKYIFFNNYYSFSDILYYNNSFLRKNMKKNLLNLYIWWPWDKIFKKIYIEENHFQNLNYTNYLAFIFSAIISSKKIYFLDKILINHRIGINTKIEKSNEIFYNNFYHALKELEIFLKTNKLYNVLKKDFINYIASFSIWKLDNTNSKFFCFLYQKLKDELWNEFSLNKYSKKYFYNTKIYKKIKYILKITLKKKVNQKKINNNDIEIVYLKKKILNCVNKIMIPFYKINDYKLKILYLILKKIK